MMIITTTTMMMMIATTAMTTPAIKPALLAGTGGGSMVKCHVMSCDGSKRNKVSLEHKYAG